MRFVRPATKERNTSGADEEDLAGELRGGGVAVAAEELEQRLRPEREDRRRLLGDPAADPDPAAIDEDLDVAATGAGELEVHARRDGSRLRRHRQDARR